MRTFKILAITEKVGRNDNFFFSGISCYLKSFVYLIDRQSRAFNLTDTPRVQWKNTGMTRCIRIMRLLEKMPSMYVDVELS